jgi:hypothetical protein
MSNVGSVRYRSAFAAVLVSGGLFVACVSNDDVDGDESGGSAGTATAGANAMAGTGTGGSTGGTGGGGSAGTSTTPPACATVATASGTSPLITDFESMTSATGTYMFESPALTGGTYIYTDTMSADSTSMLSFSAGHAEASTQALVGQIHNATWGGGMGLWFGCIDASVYTGITFWARGSSPAGAIKLNLSVNAVEVESKGGSCPDAGPCVRPSAPVEVTDEWQEFTFAWADFTPGDAAGTPVPGGGDGLYGIDFSIPNDNMARDLELAVDDFSFTAN